MHKTIHIDDIEHFLRFERLQRELQVRLTLIKERQEAILIDIEKTKDIATTLKRLRERYRFETDKEMCMLIKRHCRVQY